MDIRKLKQIVLLKKIKLAKLKMQGLIPSEAANTLDMTLDTILTNYSEELLLSKLYEYLRSLVILLDTKQIDKNTFGELFIFESELNEVLR
jgi:hypothetical protein